MRGRGSLDRCRSLSWTTLFQVLPYVVKWETGQEALSNMNNFLEVTMRKKVLAVLVCVNILVLGLAGCEKTPEEAIVREKGADSIKEYESADENAKGALREALGVPEHYKNEASYEEGGLVIDTDADVIVPEADTVNTYAVSAKEVNQDLIDTVTEAFFPGEKFYHRYSYDLQTKEDHRERATQLKKYKAEGNLDPYEHGRDENGNLQFDIDGQIEREEEAIETAPETAEKREVTPSFGIAYEGEKGEEEEVDTDCFGGVVETADGIYNYSINYRMKPDVTFSIERRREDLADPYVFSSWTEAGFLMDIDGENHISEEQIQSKLNVSFEDAKKTAEEKIERLGWDLKLFGWDYAVFCEGEGGANADHMLDAGYQFYFSRELDKVPVTHTVEYGGGLEDMDSTLAVWSYERCEIIVGDDGIQWVNIINPYEIGEVQTANVKLLDFDQVIGIYEQMMEVSNADITRYETHREYHIRRITLGYMRIYDPTKDSDTGLLVPVWDFFGGFDLTEPDGTSMVKNTGEHSTQSHLTINAIDGTVIDRGLGY